MFKLSNKEEHDVLILANKILDLSGEKVGVIQLAGVTTAIGYALMALAASTTDEKKYFDILWNCIDPDQSRNRDLIAQMRNEMYETRQ